MTLVHIRLLVAAAAAAGTGGWFWLKYLRGAPGLTEPQRLIPVMVIAGLLCRLVFVFFTPMFIAPDETAHFSYILYLSDHGSLPVQQHMWHDPAADWEYTQPPLYYLPLAPVLWLGQRVVHNLPTIFFVLRLFSVALWLANVRLALLLLNRLRITDSLVRNFVLALVCLLPSYICISSAMNNDNLVITLSGGLLCVMTTRGRSLKSSLGMGLLLGLALLAKQSAIVFIPAIIAMFLLDARQRRDRWSSALLRMGVVLATAAVMFFPWALRNWRLYHSLTPETAFVQPSTWSNAFIGLASALHNIVKTFWAVAGVSNEISYPFPLLGMVFMFLCLNWREEVRPSENQAPPPRPDFLSRSHNAPFLTAGNLALLTSFVLVMWVGYRCGMGQGRHLFPLLFPIALMLAARWRRFPVKHLEPYTTAIWLAYAFAFVLFSMWLLPAHTDFLFRNDPSWG